VIDNPELLADFTVRLRPAAWVAMDTEADSLHSYPEKVCLIQFSLPGEDALVDPLCGLDLTPLWKALEGRELVLHGADYDLRMLYRSYRFVPHAVFDTMLAARLAGHREFGLSSLVQSLLHVRLDKASQKANWSRRPLTDRMAAYARSDTRYLQPLAGLLHHRLHAVQRLDWHRQMCARLVQDCTQPESGNPDEAWRVKGANRLGRQALAVLREVWTWRDCEARAANQPPFFILSHDRLLAIAERFGHGEPPEKLLPPRFSPRRRAALMEALHRAAQARETDWPHPLRARGWRLTHQQKRQLERLETLRNRHAAALGIDPTLIASRSTLVALAHDWAQHEPTLLPWQRQILTEPDGTPLSPGASTA
jgi:ribonuclease D